MDRVGGKGKSHDRKSQTLILVEDPVPIWYPRCRCFIQWNPIFQYHDYWLLQRFRHLGKVYICVTPSSQRTSRVSKQSNPQRTQEEVGLCQRSVNITIPRDTMIMFFFFYLIDCWLWFNNLCWYLLIMRNSLNEWWLHRMIRRKLNW